MIPINLTKTEIIDALSEAINGLVNDNDNTEYMITEKIITRQIKRYENEIKRLGGK